VGDLILYEPDARDRLMWCEAIGCADEAWTRYVATASTQLERSGHRSDAS
jgi:hypothetical protein